MTIDLRNYSPAETVRVSNRLSDVVMYADRHAKSSRLDFAMFLTEAILQAFPDDKVSLFYSKVTGIIVIASPFVGNDKNTFAVSQKKSSKSGLSITATPTLETIVKLFGEHKVYGFNWRFDSASGGDGRVMVLEPNGKWRD